MAQMLPTTLESIYQFENPRVLTNLEAYEFFTKFDNDITDSSTQNDIFRKQLFDKAKEYAGEFQQYNNLYQLNAARDAIKIILEENDFDEERPPLTEKEQLELDKQIEYETAMLLNLCPMTPEEAKAYVPSLTTRSPHQISEIIEQLASFKQ